MHANDPALLNAIDMYVGLMTPDGILVQANDYALAGTGLSADDVIGRPMTQIGCWAHSAEARRRLQDAIERAAHGETVRYDTDLRLASGRIGRFELTIRPIFDDDGNVVYLVPSGVEIDDRIAVEEQLRANEQQLENAIRHAKLIVFNVNRELRYTWARNLPDGWSASDVIGRTSDAVLPPEEAAILDRIKRQVIDSGIGRRLDEIQLSVPGGKRWFTVTMEPLFDRDGSVSGLTCTSSDVTQQRAERERMRITANEHRIAAEIGREALTGKPIDALFALATERVRETLDLDLVAVLEHRAETGELTATAASGATELTTMLCGRLPELALAAFRSDDAMVVDETEGHPVPGERTLLRAGIHSVAAAPLRGVAAETPFGLLAACATRSYAFDGDALTFLRSVANVLSAATSRAKAEEELARQRNELHCLVSGSPDVIARFTPDLRLLFCNRPFWWCGNRSVATSVGCSLDELMRDNPDCYDDWWDGLQRAIATRRQIEFVVHCGGRVDEVRVVPELGADGELRALLLVARDVSAHHEAERHRLQLVEQLQTAERLSSLGELAASMAHEFNNVLMAISPFAEYFRRTFRSDAAVASAAEHVASAIARGKRITSEVLRYARPSDPSFRRIPAGLMLRKLATQFRASSQWLTIDVHVDDDDLAIRADAQQIEQVFTNLILNARDAMIDRGTITISASVANGEGDYRFGFVPEASRFVHIRVRDDGPGIAPAAIGHLFEPFFTTKRGGTGLGLAIAQQIVKRHGGFLFAENDRGAVFHMFLERDTSDPWSDIVAEPVIGEHAFKSAVVIEDDPSVGEGLATMLQMLGIHTTLVQTAASAIETIARVDPDLILLDVTLEDASGFDLHREIVERWPRLPVIFSTGHADDSLFQPFAHDPFVRRLMKPYSLEALEATIAELARTTSS